MHTLACYPVAEFGTDAQRERWLPGMLGGDQARRLLPQRDRVGVRCGRAAHPGGP
ncbi:hypothetical protein GCM10025868_45660 [Angustibacter aerolatus]|uniref:Acyl-CoA dehydrogenase/oxidase N-terminal domain-containing protein n=1 Tax=Angustibacter aerolatus TaxID=1162965 RepID=A0ABQ6JRK1_9ACTN|nr:hypothetical protein GCM10025868_45660 [Angustibacter aerolatus]